MLVKLISFFKKKHSIDLCKLLFFHLFFQLICPYFFHLSWFQFILCFFFEYFMIFFEWQKERMYSIVSNIVFHIYVYIVLRCIYKPIYIHIHIYTFTCQMHTHTYTLSLFFIQLYFCVDENILHRFRFIFVIICLFKLRQNCAQFFPFDNNN